MLKRLMAVVFGFSALAYAGEAPGQCLHFEKSQQQKTLVYEVASSCEKKQVCSIAWSVQCEDNEGNVTERSRKSDRFTLETEAKVSVRLSAENCKQAWRIDDVSYKCDDAR
jgi:hypothetical protein